MRRKHDIERKSRQEQLYQAVEHLVQQQEQLYQAQAMASLQRLQVIASEVDLSSSVHLSRLMVSAASSLKDMVDKSTERTRMDLMSLFGLHEVADTEAEMEEGLIIEGSCSATQFSAEEDE